jgi:hypothetical protein
LLKETREFLTEQGVSMAAFQGKKSESKRSCYCSYHRYCHFLYFLPLLLLLTPLSISSLLNARAHPLSLCCFT